MNHHPSSDSFGKIMEKQEYWQRKQFSERATVLCISCSSATMEEMSIITEGGRGPWVSEQNMEYTKSGMLMRFLKGSKRFFAGSILASILVAAMDMIAPQIIRIVVDGCLGEDLSRLPSLAQRTLAAVGGADYLREHLYLAAVGILLAAGISAVFQYLNTYLNTKGAESMVKTARDWLFHHIEHLPYEWHMQNQTGDIIQRCTSDVNMVRDFVAEQLIQVVRIAILIGFSIVFMVSMSVRLSVIVFLSVPLIIAYSWFFYYKIGHLFQQCDENEGVLSTITQET